MSVSEIENPAIVSVAYRPKITRLVCGCMWKGRFFRPKQGGASVTRVTAPQAFARSASSRSIFATNASVSG